MRAVGSGFPEPLLVGPHRQAQGFRDRPGAAAADEGDNGNRIGEIRR